MMDFGGVGSTTAASLSERATEDCDVDESHGGRWMNDWVGAAPGQIRLDQVSRGGKTCAGGRAHHLIVEFFHHLPRAIADAYHDDGQRVVRGHDNGILRFLAVRNLAVCNDYQNVVCPFLLFCGARVWGLAALATMCASRATIRDSEKGLGIIEGIGCGKDRWGASQKMTVITFTMLIASLMTGAKFVGPESVIPGVISM
jgi:hypothetical protein